MQNQRTKCEIWTRVMGYHRPVSQYNHGKKSEFYSRKYFKSMEDQNADLINKYSGKTAQLILFTTTSCPKCPAVKNWLGESGMEYFAIDNTMLNFSEMAEKYGVRSVPTLIAVGEKQEELWRASDLSEIKENLSAVLC